MAELESRALIPRSGAEAAWAAWPWKITSMRPLASEPRAAL